MTNTQKEVKKQRKEANAPVRKQAIETFKTVLICVLVAGALMFIAGVHYQSNIDANKAAAIKTAQTTTVQTSKH